MSLKFLQGRPFTRSIGRVLSRVDAHEFVILVSRGAKVRPEFRPTFVEGDCVPEVPDAAIGDGEGETMRDQADGIDRVPVSG